MFVNYLFVSLLNTVLKDSYFTIRDSHQLMHLLNLPYSLAHHTLDLNAKGNKEEMILTSVPTCILEFQSPQLVFYFDFWYVI